MGSLDSSSSLLNNKSSDASKNFDPTQTCFQRFVLFNLTLSYLCLWNANATYIILEVKNRGAEVRRNRGAQKRCGYR